MCDFLSKSSLEEALVGSIIKWYNTACSKEVYLRTEIDFQGTVLSDLSQIHIRFGFKYFSMF